MDPNSPETNFFAWISECPEVLPVLAQIPDEVFSPEGRQIATLLRAGKPWEHNGLPPSEDEARTFLRGQLLALLGRETGKAQRSGHIESVQRTYDLLQQCLNGTEKIPLESYTDIDLKIREFIPTGIVPLDEQISGLARGELGIVALPPGRGKSALMINFAVSALRAGRTVHYISVADQGRDELIPRIDACVLQDPMTPDMSIEIVRQKHGRAQQQIDAWHGDLWISDFTDRECRLTDIERSIRECRSDLVLIDHADDVISPYSADPTVTRHSLRVVYLHLKKLATQYDIPIWTASQTHDVSWTFDTASISELAEAKTGKATGAAIVLVFTGGRHETEGIMYCSIAKARRFFVERRFPLRYDWTRTLIWQAIAFIGTSMVMLAYALGGGATSLA